MNIFDEKGRIKGLSRQWEQYSLCLFLHLMWPSAPIALEWMLTGVVKPVSLTLTAFMYAVGLGISSRNPLNSYLSLVAGVIIAVFFGFAVHVSSAGHPEDQIAFLR